MKRSPLRAMSSKRRSELATRAQVRAEVLERDGHACQFWTRAYETAHWLPGDLVGAPTRCMGEPEVHEIIPRSAWAKGYLVPSNCVTLCGMAHHPWVGDHPEAAHRLGLHGFSHERPQ